MPKLKFIEKRTPMENAFIEMMSKNLEDTGARPKVGIFWYSRTHGCFGVDYSYYDEAPFVPSTFFSQKANMSKRVHQNYWPLLKRRNKLPSEYAMISDYTQIPRGRVFGLEDGTFRVMHGKWLDEYPEARQEILDEFELPPEKTKFVYSDHWDVGHGWGEELG
jgi:hypothetical protein